MTHLPPAGVRIITSNRRVDLICGREVPNIFYSVDRNHVPYDSKIKADPNRLFDVCELPPVSVKEEDWEIPQDVDFGDGSRPEEFMFPVPEPVNFMADDYSLYDERAKRLVAIVNKTRPSYDCKIRYDAQSRWQNEAMKVFAVSYKWESVYGKKYSYSHPCHLHQKRTSK